MGEGGYVHVEHVDSMNVLEILAPCGRGSYIRVRRHISHPYRLTALLPGLTVLVLQQTADSRRTTKRLYMKASLCSRAEGQCGDLGVEGPAETHTSCHTDALNVMMEACIYP